MLSSEALQKRNQCDIFVELKENSSNKQLNNPSSKEDNLQTKEKPKVINFFKLYKYAQKLDLLLILIGLALSAATGCGLPFFAVVAGDMIDAFEKENDEMIQKTSQARDAFLLIGAGTFLAAMSSVIVWMKIGERISVKCRKLYLKKILKHAKLLEDEKILGLQSIEQLEKDFMSMRQALGFKVGAFVFIAASLVAGGRNAISTGWLLSVIMVSTLPLLGISGVLYTFFIQLKKTRLLKAYLPAQQRSKQVIQNLSAIKQLNGEVHEFLVYSQLCNFFNKKIILYSSLVGLGAGWFSLVQFGVYALAFWFGSHCVEGTHPCPSRDQNGKYTPGAVIVIFFAFYVRLDSMQQILPTLRKIYAGMQATYRIYEVMEEEDQSQEEDQEKQHQDIKVIGKLAFTNVTVYDKTDVTKKLLDDVSLSFKQRLISIHGNEAEIQALLNVMMLMQTPSDGKVYINGEEITKDNAINAKKTLCYIDNSNGLFETTIRNNLTNDPNVTDDEIFKVLKSLDIEEIVKNYANKLQTQIGYKGRAIADYLLRRKLIIARSLLAKPNIILVKGILERKNELELLRKLVELSQDTTLFIYFGNCSQILELIGKAYRLQQGKVKMVSFSKDQLKQNDPIMSMRKDNIFYNKLLIDLPNLHNLPFLSPQRAQILCQSTNLQHYQPQILKRLITSIKPYTRIYCIGLLFSLLSGVLYPIFTIFLADILLETFKFTNQPYESSFIRDNIHRPVLVIVYIGASSLVFNFLENTLFSIVAEKMVQQIRTEAYHKVLHLPMSWFQASPLNAPFKVHSDLRDNGTHISSIPSNLFPILFKNIISTIAGLTIAFIFQWRTAMLGIIVLPMMMTAGFLLMKYFYENDNDTITKYKESSIIFTECYQNVRYVTLGNMGTLVQQLYSQKLKNCENSSLKRSLNVGFRFGLSQFLIFVSFAVMFYFGSLFLKDYANNVTVLSLFTAIFAVIWPGWTSGSNFFRAPDLLLAKKAVVSHLAIIDATDEAQIQVTQNSKFLKTQIKGKIKFTKVNLQQQQHPNNISFTIYPKQKVMLSKPNRQIYKVLIDTILRLKSIDSGQIFIDNQDIKDYDIGHLRRIVGVVGGETMIFKGTLKENVLYNVEGVSDDELVNVLGKLNLCGEGIEEQRQLAQSSKELNEACTSRKKLGMAKLLQTLLPQKSKLSNSFCLKISLARVMLKRPKIVFIQHIAQSQLDETILSIIQNISQNTTVILEYSDHSKTLKIDRILQLQSKQTKQIKAQSEHNFNWKGIFFD